MSNELDDLARALFNGQIPTIWRKLAPDTLKSLANWMSHFKRRHDQYSAWINEAEPAVMWLSGKKISYDLRSYMVVTVVRESYIH